MTDAISSVLAQIRTLHAQARLGAPTAPVASPRSDAVGRAGFGETLVKALGRVDDSQKQAAGLTQAFELGDPRVDLARVTIASQQAQVAFRATVEVRNRLVQAYQDVMNMPL